MRFKLRKPIVEDIEEDAQEDVQGEVIDNATVTHVPELCSSPETHPVSNLLVPGGIGGSASSGNSLVVPSSTSSTSLHSSGSFLSEASSILHRRQRKENFRALLAERNFEILSRKTKFVLSVFAGGRLRFVDRSEGENAEDCGGRAKESVI